jgi:hypothetical protein
MIRKLVLVMTILALAIVPLPAWAARDGARMMVGTRLAVATSSSMVTSGSGTGRLLGSGSIRPPITPTRHLPAPGNLGIR